jgi:starch phosphorylase
MNGVVNFSVLDGWWYEGYRKGAGWALTDKRTYQNQAYQDQLDAATIYSLLENEIVPLYYSQNEEGLSEEWVKVMKNSMAQIAPHYTMKRQLDDYYDKFYCKMANRAKDLMKNNFAKAKEIALWKEIVAERWDSIEIVSSEKSECIQQGQFESGKPYKVRYVVDEKGLEDAVGIEMVTVANVDGKEKIVSVEPLNLVKREGNLYTFECTTKNDEAGQFKVCYRMYPKNAELPHRQDFCYVKWFY